MKTHIAIIRDHSASMRPLTKGAMADYNLTLESINSSIAATQSATLSVVECGVNAIGAATRLVEAVSDVKHVHPLTSYKADGTCTPLWDSVGLAIETLEKIPVANEMDTAFLVMVITDGEENASRRWSISKLQAKIQELQRTDKWTFVFRVPEGSKRSLTSLGIPEGNIMEWEQTEKALAESTAYTQRGISDYFVGRSQGKTRSSSFYTNVADVSVKELKTNLDDVTKDYECLWVDKKYDEIDIKTFCISKLGEYVKGNALYQLTKTETVQDYKTICIRDKTTGKIYEGAAAKSLLGLPSYGNIKLAPGNNGKYDIFVQSTSVNRKLAKDTYLLYTK